MIVLSIYKKINVNEHINNGLNKKNVNYENNLIYDNK